MATEKASWQSRDEFISESWRGLTDAFNADVEVVRTCWQEIADAYSKPSRYYHNLDHIAAMLRLSDEHSLASKEVVNFSIFYHDIVYKVPASDNEHKSALLAAQRLPQLSVPAPLVEQVCSFIEATKTHELVEVANMDDLKLFLDFDLAILSADWEAYAAYLQNIRKEYKYFPDLLYYPGRNGFLKKMLAKDHIYHTEAFRVSFEEKARRNLQRELEMR